MNSYYYNSKVKKKKKEQERKSAFGWRVNPSCCKAQANSLRSRVGRITPGASLLAPLLEAASSEKGGLTIRGAARFQSGNFCVPIKAPSPSGGGCLTFSHHAFPPLALSLQYSCWVSSLGCRRTSSPTPVVAQKGHSASTTVGDIQGEVILEITTCSADT